MGTNKSKLVWNLEVFHSSATTKWRLSFHTQALHSSPLDCCGQSLLKPPSPLLSTHRRDIIKTRNPTRLLAHVAWEGVEVLARRVLTIYAPVGVLNNTTAVPIRVFSYM